MQARVGILGAGQLGRMLALAGYPLGIECVLLDRDERSPGAQVARFKAAALDDAEAAASLAAEVDVVTVEIENVPADVLRAAARHAPVHPPPDAVAAAQDRLAEKELFRSLGIPTTPFVRVDTSHDLDRAHRELGLPLVLKARRMGYDGRGQRIVRNAEELHGAWSALGEVPAIAEAWVDFDRELSLVAVRGANGQRAFYPLSENVHRDGILRISVAPFEDERLQRNAEERVDALMQRLDYRGVLALEFFHANGELLANEMAPRVHNTGHWTIEGAVTSQFENHLRAVLGWPLGDASPRGHAAMVNLLGNPPPLDALLSLPGVHVHLYGKSPRPGRKIGHCTIVDPDRRRLLERLAALTNVIEVSLPNPTPRNP
ncbi:MAG: 5-(carboxyamino)imidazole ribonucleotide synthase [Gammaproteobacteria bacterium]